MRTACSSHLDGLPGVGASLATRAALFALCAAVAGGVVYLPTKIDEYKEPNIWGIARIGSMDCDKAVERAGAVFDQPRPDGAAIAHAAGAPEDGRPERWFMCVQGRLESHRFSGPSGPDIDPEWLDRAYASRARRISGKPITAHCGVTRFSAGHVVIVLDARPGCRRYEVTYETHVRLATGRYGW